MKNSLGCFFVFVGSLALISVGCSNSENLPNQDISNTQPDTGTELPSVVKIAVMSDGNVFVNSEAVPIESLGSKLDACGNIKEVWYHREAPDAAEPHENAMKVIGPI